MLPHHGSDSKGNGEKAFYEKIGDYSHGIISSHIEGIHEHPKVKTIQSFCQIPKINTCDIPCAYHYYGDKYINQATTVPLKDKRGQLLGEAAICPSGDVTAYAPYKAVSINLEDTKELFASKNTPHQIYGCQTNQRYVDYSPQFPLPSVSRKIYQTTAFVEDEFKGLQMHAYIICTYLNSDDKFDVKKYELDLQKLNSNSEVLTKEKTIFAQYCT